MRAVIFSTFLPAIVGLDAAARSVGLEPVAVITPRAARNAEAEARRDAILTSSPEGLDACFWHDGMAMFHQYVSPWYSMLDDAKYQRSVDRVASLGITAIAGCHTPAIGSAFVERAITFEIEYLSEEALTGETINAATEAMMASVNAKFGDRVTLRA